MRPKEMPPSMGGGVVGSTAMRLIERSEFQGVEQPEVIAECVVRWVLHRHSGCQRGIMAVTKYYEDQNRHGKLTKFLKKVVA